MKNKEKELPRIDNDVVSHEHTSFIKNAGMTEEEMRETLEKLNFTDPTWTTKSEELAWRLKNLTKKELAMGLQYAEMQFHMECNPIARIIAEISGREQNED